MLTNYLFVALISLIAAMAIWKVTFSGKEFALNPDEGRIILPIMLVTIALMFGVISPLSSLSPLTDSFRELTLKLD